MISNNRSERYIKFLESELALADAKIAELEDQKQSAQSNECAEKVAQLEEQLTEARRSILEYEEEEEKYHAHLTDLNNRIRLLELTANQKEKTISRLEQRLDQVKSEWEQKNKDLGHKYITLNQKLTDELQKARKHLEKFNVTWKDGEYTVQVVSNNNNYSVPTVIGWKEF